jgi:hypothetical protein
MVCLCESVDYNYTCIRSVFTQYLSINIHFVVNLVEIIFCIFFVVNTWLLVVVHVLL